MLAPWMRESGRFARAARTARRAKEPLFLNFSRILKKSCQPPPSFSFTLTDSMLGHASRDRRPFHCRWLPVTKIFQCHRSFCTSGVMLVQKPSSCCQHVSKPTSPCLDDLHDERRPDDSVHAVETGAWYIVEESTDFVGAVCVGALKAESCSHRSSPEVYPERWQREPTIDSKLGRTSTQTLSCQKCHAS